jgi:oligoribonuclease NrnB/cAMP/cGMP phosphodiesterase (DHH superfamily)
VTGKPTFREECEEEASNYADIVARSGNGVTYDEAFAYFMDKYLPKYREKELTNGKTNQTVELFSVKRV